MPVIEDEMYQFVIYVSLFIFHCLGWVGWVVLSDVDVSWLSSSIA